FYLPYINWTETTDNVIHGYVGHNQDCYDAFLSTYSFLNLVQVNMTPNNGGVFLDLMFTYIDNLEISSAIDPITCPNHHHITYSWCVSTDSFIPLEAEFTVFDFVNGNYDLLNSYLSGICWDECFKDLEINEMVSVFYNMVLRGLEAYVPKMTIKLKL